MTCGNDPTHDMSPDDAQAVRDFQKFLLGKGTRCPRCLHKAKHHHSWCGVDSCDCQASQQGVRAWWSRRAANSARPR